MINVYNFGVILQKPMNWGIDQFRSEDKIVQDDVVAKTSNVALKALKALGAVFVIVFTSPVYALGALFKFFSMHSKETSEEASTTDQVAQNALKKVNVRQGSEQEEINASSVKSIITKIEDISFRKKVNIVDLEQMVTPYLADEKSRGDLFVVLKHIELELIYIRDNSSLSDVDKDVKISADEMKDFLVKHFGIAGYFYSSTYRSIFDANGSVQDRAKNAALFLVLEKMLKLGEGQKDLELVKKLIKVEECKLVFRDEELYWSDEDRRSILNNAFNFNDDFEGDDFEMIQERVLLFHGYLCDYEKEINRVVLSL